MSHEVQQVEFQQLLLKNNYSTDFIERNTYIRPSDSSNNSYTTATIIPYKRVASETIAGILRPYNIRVAHKSISTLYTMLLTNVRTKTNLKTDQATYIDETGRNLTTRLNEHKRATKKGDLNNNIDQHHLKTSHIIEWDSVTCLSTNYYSC